MFQTTIKEAVKIPGLDYLHLTGINSKGDAKIGDYITDGEQKFEITSIPFVRRAKVKPIDEIEICIRPGNFTIDNLIGKTFYKIPM